MKQKIITKSLSAILLLLLPFLLTAQEKTDTLSYLELTGGIGLMNLVENNANLELYPVANDIEGSIESSRFRGYAINFGLMGNKFLRDRISIQSGLKFQYLNGRYEGTTEIRILDPIQDITEETIWNNKAIFRGFEIPVLMEFRNPFKGWSLYTQLGLSVAYSKLDLNQKRDESVYFSYYLMFDEICDCYLPFNLQEHTPPSRSQSNGGESIPQYQFNGLFSIGAIIKRKDNKEWRIGYRLSSNLLPFRKLNNAYDRVYEPHDIRSVNQYQMIHLLEFGMQWPDPKVTRPNKHEKKPWHRIYAGLGVSIQTAYKKNDWAGRSGLGWGRNAQLMYLTRLGWGARFELARWIAPKSRYGTETRTYRVDIVYQGPAGFQAYGGYSRRRDGDADGGGGSGKGFHLGAGYLLSLHDVVNLQLLYTNHYYPKFGNERILVDLSLGTLLSF